MHNEMLIEDLSRFHTPFFKTGRIMVYQCPTVRPSVRFMVKFRIFIPELWDFIHQIVRDFKAIFRMSRCKLRTLSPMIDQFKYKQIITDKTNDYNSTIDLIFTNVNSNFQSGTLETYYSDHTIIWISLH